VSVGFYFAFGHSTIVFIAAFVAYWTASVAERNFEFLKNIGGIVSTCISAFFLFAIALINILILRGVYRAFRTNYMVNCLAAGIPALAICINLVQTGCNWFEPFMFSVCYM